MFTVALSVSNIFRLVWNAFECKAHSGYHINNDHVIMEFLKNGKDVNPGESGEVVITGLSNYTMPLIRYKLGDIAVPIKEKCSCGRGFHCLLGQLPCPPQ